MPTFRGVLADAAIAVPPEVLAALGSSRKRPAVCVNINGVEVRTTLMVYGGVTYIGLRKDQRGQMGITSGDVVEVAVALDTKERTVDVPPELAAVLNADPIARERFEALSLTNRREYVQWLTSAKRVQTCKERLHKVAELLKSGRRTPLSG
jgi:Bacteriocin-protection, YdeI or OmpD-Associated/Domain of unknown function (DUF1905)